MKNLLLFVSIAFMLLTSLQCQKDKKEPEPEPELTLPPITTQGLNTVGCKIDGKVWVPYSKTSVPCLYAAVSKSNNWTFEFGAQQINNFNIATNYIQMYFGSLKEDSAFIFTKNRLGNILYLTPENSTGTIKLNTDLDLKNGRVNIILFDSINQIISGTFYCSVIDSVTKIRREITDGRFDLKFAY